MFLATSFVPSSVQSAPAAAAGSPDTLHTAADSLAALTSLPDSAEGALSAIPTEEGGGVLNLILASLPTDPASIFAILLLVGCAVLVFRYGMQKGDAGQQPTDRGGPAGRGGTSKS